MDSTYNRFKKFCIEYSKGFSSLQEAELTTVLELIQKLTELRNHPNERYGKEKAEFISNWLNSNSVKASIIPVDNLDETKTANKDNKWYNVLAILGDEHSSDAAPKGLFSVHHDQVAKLNPSFNLTDEMHLEHPWLEDDIIQLATSMMEAVSFQKWWNIQSQKHNLIGSIHYIISDGEEVNTLGMRGLLEKFYAEKHLPSYDFGIICEATSKNIPVTKNDQEMNLEIPHVAYQNRGKITGTVKLKETNDIAESFKEFSSIFKYIQIRLWKELDELDLAFANDRESSAPTALSATHGEFKHTNSTVFWEARTNPLSSTVQSLSFVKNIFSHVYKSNSQKIPEFRTPSISFTFDLSSLHYEERKDHSVISISNGSTQHPGYFNPLKRTDALLVLDLLIDHLTEKEKDAITNIIYGDKSKPNSVSEKGSITFSEPIDFKALQNRIKETKETIGYEKFVTESCKNHLEKIITNGTENEWKAFGSPLIPPRDGVSVSENNWWIVTSAQKRLRENFEQLGISADISTATVFPAMNDSGPLTYPHFRENIFKNGESIICIGTGNIKRLHSDHECLTPDTLMLAMVQYKGLLQELLIECIHQKGSV